MSKNSLIPDEDSISLRVHDTPESSSGGVAFMAPNQKVMMQATGASTIEQGPLTTRGLSVILPAYNEEAVIAMTVAQCVEALSVIAPDYEIIIVDDGSRDHTGDIADELAAANPHIKVVHNRPNRGYGGALIAGFNAATKSLSFFMDSDGQFDIHDIALLIAQREQGHRAVLGYRKHRQDVFMRKVNAWGWNMLVSLLFGLRVRDVDCAFKLYDTALIRVCNVQSEGAMINTELLVKLSRLGVHFVEVPVHHYPRKHGSATGANLRVIAHAFSELLRLRRQIHRWNAVLPPAE
ncbi:MAG: glycosyltransferase family 2 protein [Ktedonobacterales bacterium]